MRLFATCFLSLSLAAIPAMADGNAAKDKDSDGKAKTTETKKTNDTAKKTESASSVYESELQQLRDLLKTQAEEIERQRLEIEREHQKVVVLEQRLAGSETAGGPGEAGAAAGGGPAAGGAAAATPAVRGAQEKPKESPLSFRIGGADFTPGGFVDFENVFRSTNTGNVAATSFGAIPFSNTVAGHLTEYRSTGQYSRFNLTTHATYGKNDITGYLEFDFNGNDAANVFVTSNPHTDRLRLYWLDLRRGKWEFLGGQTWGLQTPNRVGVSPRPSDLSLGYHEDAGIGVGYNYTRAGEFRAAYHFNDNWVWAVAAQNPDQFTNGEVVFPVAFNAQIASTINQFDAANQTTTPNVGPDILTKLAYDNEFAGGRHFHWEGGAIETAMKITVLAPTNATTASFVKHTNVGGGVFGDVLVDLFRGSEGKNIRFVASGMWGKGIGRYLNGLAPNAVVFPVNASGATCAIVGTTATGCDAQISGVHAGDVVGGFEFVPHPKHQFGVYYGGMYAQQNAAIDITSTAATKPFIGFGFYPIFNTSGIALTSGSANTNNRAVQEGSIDWTYTMWKNPQYGALLLVTQASYIVRSPWFVSAGAPKNAHLGMGYVSLRYVLP
ncbi:MAG TPA: hypothetical protein VEH49_07645 [Methylomirabilota bacterium]|nr:hypothetical protein [Methylomirabilota bacterium]